MAHIDTTTINIKYYMKIYPTCCKARLAPPAQSNHSLHEAKWCTLYFNAGTYLHDVQNLLKFMKKFLKFKNQDSWVQYKIIHYTIRDVLRLLFGYLTLKWTIVDKFSEMIALTLTLSLVGAGDCMSQYI